MRGLFPLPLLLLPLFAGLALGPDRQDEGQVLDPSFHHLGDDQTPEWPEASAEPEGSKLEIEFRSRPSRTERTLLLTQRHVSNRWSVQLNGKEFAVLEKNGDELKEVHYRIPGGSFRTGTNTLALIPDNKADDIIVGNIRLFDMPLREVLGIVEIEISVRDKATGKGVPARLTLHRTDGDAVPVRVLDGRPLPVRAGIAYTGMDGKAVLDVPTGPLTIWASKGTEWGIDRVDIQVTEKGGRAKLKVGREIDTRGWIACDTHIHTLTWSGHGDAAEWERVLTLPAEGVELAIATDHNHQTDYRSLQKELGASKAFTAVTGNEVTTSNGHFNAFPLPPGGPIPNQNIEGWPALMADIRAKGAEVIILNHVRWPDRNRGPWGVFGLDPETGLFDKDPGELGMDAVEVFNSTTDTEPWDMDLRDWFGLLNRGWDIKAVGSSDSHTVGDPVGQGRTWIRSKSDDPGKLDVPALCQALKAGQAVAGVGIFADLEVEGKGVGSLVQPKGREVTAKVRVACASWGRPTLVELFQDGKVVASSAVTKEPGIPFDEEFSFSIPTPSRDAWLAVVVRGEKPEGPWWAGILPDTGALTNPIRLDVDGDGAWQSPLETKVRTLPEPTS